MHVHDIGMSLLVYQNERSNVILSHKLVIEYYTTFLKLSEYLNEK